MMAFERWDVVTALFPFTDVAARKPRPVLVLSGSAFNREHGLLIGCMITRAARSRWPSDHDIAGLQPAGLQHSSIVRWKLFTLPFTVIRAVSEALRRSIVDRLQGCSRAFSSIEPGNLRSQGPLMHA